MAWIDQVGENYFNKNGVTSKAYVKALTTGHCLFDELALLLAAVSNNIHVMVIIENSYWTTRKDNVYNNVDVRLAYTGEISFKEIVPVPAPEQKENLIVDMETGASASASGCDEESCNGSCSGSDSDSGYEENQEKQNQEEPQDSEMQDAQKEDVRFSHIEITPHETTIDDDDYNPLRTLRMYRY